MLIVKESLSNIENYIISRVKEEREKCNYTQEWLSNELGKGSSYIAHIEAPSKKNKYNVHTLNEIAKIFNCSPKEF